MIKHIKAAIPDVITTFNLLSGCCAIFMAFHHNEVFHGFTGREWVYILIGMAAVFDFCDGAAARLLHAYSPVGKELDSLADLVSFGVAPAMLMLNIMLAQNPASAWCLVTLLIPAAGALRLANFNIDDDQATSFRGLPIPANAIFWIGAASWISQYGYPGNEIVAVLVLLVSITMICRFRMFSLKFKTFGLRENFRRYVIILAAIAFVVFNGLPGLSWTILLYLLISLFGRKENNQ